MTFAALSSIMAQGQVRSGFTFRERIVNDSAGRVAIIQMKDIKAGYSGIEKSGLTRVTGEGIGPQHYLANGDVLLIAKGANNYAVAYDLDLPHAVAASAFFVLRPDRTIVDSYYLAWWINQKPMQEYLHQNMAGTYIPNITKPAVEGIEVPLPPLELQRLIATVHSLALAEQRIMDELRTKRQQLVDQILSATIQHPTS